MDEQIKKILEQLTAERKESFEKLRKTILDNLPEGFAEELAYGMISYVVPLSIYPDGYHCKKDQSLPFISIASQKNFIALYHMGIYADTELLNWFVSEYPKYNKSKLDMGKSCIRFKKFNEIPYDLIAELVGKISVKQWIDLYEKNFRSKK